MTEETRIYLSRKELIDLLREPFPNAEGMTSCNTSIKSVRYSKEQDFEEFRHGRVREDTLDDVSVLVITSTVEEAEGES